MGNIQLTYDDLLGYVVAINLLLGFLFGFFPMHAGIKLHNRKYGVFGLAGAVVGGGIAGILLSFPIAAIFTWLIMRDVHAPAAIADEHAAPTANTE